MHAVCVYCNEAMSLYIIFIFGILSLIPRFYCFSSVHVVVILIP